MLVVDIVAVIDSPESMLASNVTDEFEKGYELAGSVRVKTCSLLKVAAGVDAADTTLVPAPFTACSLKVYPALYVKPEITQE